MRRSRWVMAIKLLRDLWARKGAIFALVLIMAVGIGCYEGMAAVWRDMDGSRVRYYADQRIADFTVDVKRAPRWAVAELAELPNVRAVQGRVSMAVLIDLPERLEPISGIAVSLPERRTGVINDILLRSGTYFSGADEEEVILNEAFARENGLAPGSRIKALFLDRRHDLLVVGTAMSPEFVYVLPPGGGLAPDPGRFGIMYCTESFLRKSCDLEGASNQVVGLAHDDSKTALANTLDLIEERLDPYGVTNTTPREELASVRFLGDELAGLRVSATVMPAVFLAVAALVLNVLIGRLVAQQRTVIGTLRALGYSRSAIRRHYLAMGSLVGLAGGLAGIALGFLIQDWTLKVYRQYYALPRIEAHLYWDILFYGLAGSVFFALLGVQRAVRHAAGMEPAEAMRPPPPETGSRILLERVGFLWRRLSFRWKMILRTVFRNPFRSAVTVFAGVVATALIVSTLSLVDSLDYLISYEFERVSRQDVTVSLREPKASVVAAEMNGLAGMSGAELQLSVACDLAHGSRRKRVGVVGLPRGNRLHTPLDRAGRPIVVPASGLVLTRKLAEILDAGVGNTIRLRPLLGRRLQTSAPVVAIVEMYFGLGAYADIGYLSRLLGEEHSANAILAKSFGGAAPKEFFAELKERPAVVGLSQRRVSLDQMRETFGEHMGTMIGSLVLFAGLIAFGSVLNAALVSLSERQREVGTLRVLGYTPAQAAMIFSGESLLLNGVGVLLGLAAGVALAHLLSIAYDTELYRFPTVIRPSRLVISAALMAAFAAAAQALIYRMIRKVHWLDALKTRE